jgi:hypothetical protein
VVTRAAAPAAALAAAPVRKPRRSTPFFASLAWFDGFARSSEFSSGDLPDFATVESPPE